MIQVTIVLNRRRCFRGNKGYVFTYDNKKVISATEKTQVYIPSMKDFMKKINLSEINELYFISQLEVNNNGVGIYIPSLK